MPLRGPAAAAVFTELLTTGPLSRVAVAQRTGLSSAAVTKAVRPLLAAGYLDETPDRQARVVGRPASPLRVRADSASFVGVKVTDDELIGVATDLLARPVATARRPVRDRSVPVVVAGIATLVAELAAPGVWGLGVSLAGDVDVATGVVHYSPFLGWRSVPLAAMVAEATGLDTVVDNDVRALTVAQQWFGAGAGLASFAVVTVGTGVGCGLVVNGAVVEGTRGVAGEVGHVLAEPGGPRCRCGNTGCVEAIAGSDALSRELRGGPDDERVHRRAGRAIGVALATVANVIGPERIVLSGIHERAEAAARETFEARSFGTPPELVVVPLPFEEWACGAAALAVRNVIVPSR
ncbi:MAG TPA: ROK family transcriptional regulator [Pseudonocardiaceae bacterium]|nr:ROK family transcriptional regulator [Pseudonocardiaceae bacterium]